MTLPEYNIFPLSESAIVVEFGRAISIDLNDKALGLAASLEADPFPGFVEAVPAYASTTVFYDPMLVRKLSVPEIVADRLGATSLAPERAHFDPIEIPVDFSEDCSLDLFDVCSLTKLSNEELISRFLARTYRVFMLGFLPGFAYMGEVDESIAVPRKETPRTAVPKGSVGIAGKQTGIYPFESPGGWQIIGRTKVEMFTPSAETPCRLKPGNYVRFVRSS
ncbi:MAG TPA: 5-oxoprolinase subunit PxpB [Pyrinomonadaceae bacterium]|nr:5-oxoprolinase subunit PxpB [Pyrinomonadaceae bacterium]